MQVPVGAEGAHDAARGDHERGGAKRKGWAYQESPFATMMRLRRFLWAQKVPTMLHAVTMSVTGLSVVAPGNWAGKDLLSGRHELVAAFLGLELAFLLQACTDLIPFLTQQPTLSLPCP